MRAMILAAGRGERMRELTLHTPKPLLQVGGKYLIEYAIQNLCRAGIKEIVINVAYYAAQITAALGNGEKYGVNIAYSEEKERLETGGGIFKALALLGDKPFLVVSADVMTDYPLQKLPHEPLGLAHLVMTDNPHFHPQGDFGMKDGFLDLHAAPKFTFANIGIYRKELFAHCSLEHFPLNKLLIPAIEKHQITGEYFRGNWHNIGSPEDLVKLDSHFALEQS